MGPQAFNRYSFVVGNPLRYIDPSGHGICDAPGGGPDNPDCQAREEDQPPDVSILWDPYWHQFVGNPHAAEQAFLLFLTDPGYFLALYADPVKWAASEDVANLDVFTQYSVLHETAEDLLLRGFDPDLAATLRAEHAKRDMGESDTSPLFAVLGAGATLVIVGGDNPAAAQGRAIHAAFDYGPGFDKEVTLPSGQRVDAVSWDLRLALELKPDNPSAVRKGWTQVRKYVRELFEMTGEAWTGRVVTYDRKRR
jgi:hypothetical protein